jgi:dinuclear metal center YbgI/SA1388 family protein
MANLYELVDYSNRLLASDDWTDYCPNGLQLDGGRPDISRLAMGVTASQWVIDQAIAWGAQLLLVHHGYFWKGEAQPLVGIKGRRVRSLMCNGLSLLAYHLPLDGHPELGNNALFGKALGLEGRPWEGNRLLWLADLPQPLSGGQLLQMIDRALSRTPLRLAARGEISRAAWCTGAAQDLIEQAAVAGAQAFISGECSERIWHLVNELNLHYFAAGHHATERFGIQALGVHLAERFGLETAFFDENNPV